MAIIVNDKISITYVYKFVAHYMLLRILLFTITKSESLLNFKIFK